MIRLSTWAFIFWIAVSPLFAQPNITALNLPHVGDVSTIGRCSDPIDAMPLNASAGPMQTWDFSSLTEFSEDAFTFVDPASTPWSVDFPASNLCGIGWDDSYSYYLANGSALETEGNALIVPGPPPEDTAKFLMAANPERIVELPYTYGDAFTDAFSGTFNAFGFMGTMNGTVDLEVDGYGTLILPTGTYTNVVRYHLDRVQNNTIIGNTTQTTKEQWAWVSADHRFWILLMEINFNGFNTDEVVWYDKNPLPAGPSGQAEVVQAAWTVHPNPVEAGTSVSVTSTGNASGLRMEVIDATGRMLRTFPAGTTRIPTVGMTPGAYMIRFLEQNGTPAGTTRLIVR